MSFSVDRLFDRVLFYLKLLGKKVVEVNKEKYFVKVEERVNKKRIEITIALVPPFWVTMRGKLLDGEEIRKLGGMAYIVYRELLKLSFRSAEFKFAMDDEYNIYITEDIHFAALTFDVFDEEYNAIPAAAKTFYDRLYPEIKQIAESQKVEIT